MNKEKESFSVYKQSISSNLQYLIKTYSLNILELSIKSGISYPSLYGIVYGKRNPTLKTLAKLADYFQISLASLIGDLPLTVTKNNFFKSIPVIKWEEVINYLKNNIDIKNHPFSLISSSKPIKDKTFALTANKFLEDNFGSNNLLIFEVVKDLPVELLDNQFVLVQYLDNPIQINKIIIEGNKKFLCPLSNRIPPYAMNDDIKILCRLVQSKLN